MAVDRAHGESPQHYILCSDLFKIYKRHELEVVALRGLDLKVQPGDLLAIVGPSGSGKTTLLNILAGLDHPSAGKVQVGKWDLLKLGDRDLVAYRRQEVGFVWQITSRNLFPYLTAVENVELPLSILGYPKRERAERAKGLLEAVGLDHRLHHTPEKLSGGEQQRVAIAVAMANTPPLLLADEPTGEVDNKTANEILAAFQSVNQLFGTTVVIVTHYGQIAQYVDRVVTIRDGKTSTETVQVTDFRRRQKQEGKTMEEFLVVDSSGRLQLPKALLEKLGLKDRAKVKLEDGRITLTPPEEP